jgi:hypothetical protein
MDKQTAKQTLDTLMASIAEATKKAEELKAIINTPDVPEVYQGFLLSPKQEDDATHWGIYGDGTAQDRVSLSQERRESGLVFASKDNAINYCKMLRLRHKARVAMSIAWNGKLPNFTTDTQHKYAVIIRSGRVRVEQYMETFFPICFPTRSSADAFVASMKESELILLITSM